MTLPIQIPRTVQSADGVQDTFSYDFLVLDETHLQVFEDAILTTKAYTVTGIGNASGGTVVFSPVVPAAGVSVSLVLNVPLDQETDYQPYDPFPANTHEAALDKLTQISQQQQDEITRSLKAGVDTPPGVSYGLPAPLQAAGLYWDDVPNPLNIVNGPSAQQVEDLASQAAASAAAAANSASQAAASAGNAATSEANAATSASNAATSEANAATSETNAAASAAAAQDAVNNINYYDIHGGFIDEPRANENITTFPSVRQFQFPTNLFGTKVTVGTNPSALTILSLRNNDVEFATISIDAAGTVLLSGTQTTIAASDLFTVVTPANLNGLRDTYYTLAAKAIVTP